MHYLFSMVITSAYLTCSEGWRKEFVTCGSTIKLRNTAYDARLHSHDIKYGRGSKQQSVTAIEAAVDANSHWVVKSASCARGQPVRCGQTIRLEHLTTGMNLHSHDKYKSPLSGYQEVSAFDGRDEGDDWELICGGEVWERDVEVKLRHGDTSVYLSVSGQRYGQPIDGQLEVVGSHWDMMSHWKAAEGLYIHPTQPNHYDYYHSEL